RTGRESSMSNEKPRLSRTSPSLHLFAIVIIFAISLVGHIAIIWSGELKGYSPSKVVAARNLALFIPILIAFFWLTRRQRFRGEMVALTAAVFLFAVGSLVQYRLFSDPEYGSRGSQRQLARDAKAQAIRLRNIQTGYDDKKKTFMFGSPQAVPDKPSISVPVSEYSLFDILKSINTYIPILGLLAFAGSFLVFKSDAALLWLQRHSLIIGLATLTPFLVAVMLFSEEGKFLGQTTPWEGVKILFLLSFAGMLADTYTHLRRTRWGLPPARYFLPFLVIAAMPVVPFFALSDFGQMLVFFGVYVMLYIVAVRKRAQLVYAVLLVAMVFGIFYATSTASTGFGLPSRVHFRFYQWLNTWEPPPPDTWWWKRDFERYLKAVNLQPDPGDAQEIWQRNIEAWSDKVLQQSQALFGIYEGGVTGEGLGLGFPETVAISDSDFIYAAIGEEMGLAGGLAVLLAVGAFVFAGSAISLSARDMFTKLLAAGFTSFVGFQALVNIGGVVRVIPMTGITLPFVSHGGWSLITSFAMLGILLAFSHRNALARPVVDQSPAFIPVR
ncbi:MAG TPA: FtsW/RodA/SpoVE family cell cycle protein, partial [Blastocatellia bacterium]|nr:FtsW/RodA/SpoVE family cell cycle protein [Blastocatellia bacterium]